MVLVYEVVLILHIISWAVIIGAWLTHLHPPVVVTGVPHAAAAALLTGIALTGIASASDAVADPNNAKIGVKLVVALIVTVLAYLGHPQTPRCRAGTRPRGRRPRAGQRGDRHPLELEGTTNQSGAASDAA
jgi:hypothetical protein